MGCPRIWVLIFLWGCTATATATAALTGDGVGLAARVELHGVPGAAAHGEGPGPGPVAVAVLAARLGLAQAQAADVVALEVAVGPRAAQHVRAQVVGDGVLADVGAPPVLRLGRCGATRLH